MYDGWPSLKTWSRPRRRYMSSNGSDGACRRCSKSCTSLPAKKGKITTLKEPKKWLKQREQVESHEASG